MRLFNALKAYYMKEVEVSKLSVSNARITFSSGDMFVFENVLDRLIPQCIDHQPLCAVMFQIQYDLNAMANQMEALEGFIKDHGLSLDDAMAVEQLFTKTKEEVDKHEIKEFVISKAEMAYHLALKNAYDLSVTGWNAMLEAKAKHPKVNITVTTM